MSRASTLREDPSVSIIVPTFNRRERLRRLLSALNAARSREPFEVVVAVDGAADDTAEIVATLRPRYPLRVLSLPHGGPAAARNRAILEARGDVLLFLDDDVVPVPELVQRHVDAHRRYSDVAVFGPMLPFPGLRLAPWLRWEALTLRRQYDAMLAGEYEPTARQFYTANASVRRVHALAAGGFDETFTRAEDVEFAYRLEEQGVRFCFRPDAIVLHEPDRSFDSWLLVGYEYGRHDVRLTRDRGRDWVLRVARREFGERHVLVRVVARWCVGNPRRVWKLIALGRALMPLASRASTRVAVGLCSVLFNLQFWQGVADESGLGESVWGEMARLLSPQAAVPHGPATVER